MARQGNSERTPLLNGARLDENHESQSKADEKTSFLPRLLLHLGPPSTVKILLAGFLISLSFSFTQVPIFYVFRLMQCDVYYETHPPHEGPGDRCSVNEIAAGTATQFSILGMSTTFCGTWNLFVAGWAVKRWGPRLALVMQTLIPAVRVSTQIIGVLAGGKAGIIIIQCTQLVTILGGPAGYILVVNTIAGELVEPIQRTAVFGKLQGCIMLGTATGFLLGGMVGDAFGIRMPFQVAFFLFCCSSTYARLVLPYISPESLSDGRKTAARKGFLAPLRILAPQRLRLASGQAVKHYGVLFLCCGVFLGVLSTGYAPILIQMYATAAFDFNQADNGWLMSGNALMRGFFLIFIFPRVIALGRRWWTASSGPAFKGGRRSSTLSRIPSEPEEFEAPVGTQTEEEPVSTEPVAEEDRSACHFDLFFLRWSLVVDGALTTLAAFASQSWHVYLAAFLLPFGSGSAPAAKGVITEMIPSSQRTDALNAITLVENIARLSTAGLFGLVFAALADAGKAYLTFFCNAAIAVVGMLVLCLSHFPPRDSCMIEDSLSREVSSTEDRPVEDESTDQRSTEHG